MLSFTNVSTSPIPLNLTRSSNSISVNNNNIAYHSESNRFASVFSNEGIYPCSGIYRYKFIINGNPKRIIFGLSDGRNCCQSFSGIKNNSYGYHGSGYIYNNAEIYSSRDNENIFIMNSNDNELIMVYDSYCRNLSFEYNGKFVTFFNNLPNNCVLYPTISLSHPDDYVEIISLNPNTEIEPELLFTLFNEYFQILSLDSINFMAQYNPLTQNQFISEFKTSYFSLLYTPLCCRLFKCQSYPHSFFRTLIKLLIDVAISFDKFLCKNQELPISNNTNSSSSSSNNINNSSMNISGTWLFEYKHPQFLSTTVTLKQKGDDIQGKSNNFTTRGTIENDTFIVLRQQYKSNKETISLALNGYLLKNNIIVGYYIDESTNEKSLCLARKLYMNDVNDIEFIRQNNTILFELIGKMMITFLVKNNNNNVDEDEYEESIYLYIYNL